MLEKKIPVILDGDPGHDDAIAWTLAASSPYWTFLLLLQSQETSLWIKQL